MASDPIHVEGSFAWLYLVQHGMISAALGSDPDKVHRVAALEAIKRETKGPGPLPPADDIERLADELFKHCRGLFRHLGMEERGDDWLSLDMLRESRGLVWLDAAGAEYLEGIGERGAYHAGKFREACRARLSRHKTLTLPAIGDAPMAIPELFRAWLGVPPPIVIFLAQAAWVDVVEPEVRRHDDNQTSLALPVIEVLAKSTARGSYVSDGAIRSPRGEQLIDFQMGTASMDLANSETLVRRGGELLSSIAHHRLLRWEVRTGNEQMLSGHHEPRRIVVPGSYDALAEAIGCNSNKHATDLRAIVHAQARMLFPTGKGIRENLIILREEDEAPGRSAVLILTLGDALLPRYVFGFDDDRSLRGRESRRLVPVVELPPLAGLSRPNEYGSLAAFQLLLVAEMRRRAVEFFQRGGVLLESAELARMARTASMPPALLSKVVDGWQSDGTDAPAFLSEVERGRLALAPAHAKAQEFIRRAGERELTGAHNGRLAVKKRWRRHHGAADTATNASPSKNRNYRE